jgi:hypothetical protein
MAAMATVLIPGQVKPEEMKVIVGAYAEAKQADALWTDGLHIAGERYVVTKIDERSIYGRKVSQTPFFNPVRCGAGGAR